MRGLLKRIRESLGRAKTPDKGLSPRGILIFRHTSEVIQAEKLLKEAGLDVKVVGPPPEVRTGCDLALEFPLVAQLLMAQVLDEAGIEPMDVLPLQDLLLEPVSLYHTKDFGDYLMVRAANMKITVAKADLRIVNVSGGGCPDVPYLADMLVGTDLLTGPEPRKFGTTLCGYALQLAYEELKRLCRG